MPSRASLSSPSTTSLHERPRHQKLHLLVAATGPRDVSWAQALVVRLSKNPLVEMRAIVDDVVPRLSQTIVVMQNRPMRSFALQHSETRAGGAGRRSDARHGHESSLPDGETHDGEHEEDDVEFYRHQAYELVGWADLLVLAPLDADGLAKMLAGISDSFLLEVLRGWDVAKQVLLVPGMSTPQWESPVTRRHLAKLHKRWSWVRVLPPVLWHYEGKASSASAAPKRVVGWSGFHETLNIIKNQADLLALGREVDVATGLVGREGLLDDGVGMGLRSGGLLQHPVRTTLPPEIWTIIMEHVGDWELAQALGVYTSLPVPEAWEAVVQRSTTTATMGRDSGGDVIKAYGLELAWTVLTGGVAATCRKLMASPPGFRDLPALVVKLVIRFGLVDVLAYLERNRPELFAAGFGGKVLPTKASAYYGRTDVLDYWKESRFFSGPATAFAADTAAGSSAPAGTGAGADKEIINLAGAAQPVAVLAQTREWDAECVNGASKNGFVRVLDWWWRRSGLPLRYTEAALEQASGRGHLLVLEWWRDAGAQDDRIVLRPGRSLLWAAQHGRVDVLRWWDASGIPVAHADAVPKVASRWGHVEVLELWRTLRGDDDLAFDADVLVQPTIHQHLDVLEWWRKFAHGELEGQEGRKHRVEYRTCNIEEALEDAIGDQMAVRRWWARNGLKLGLGGNEWMKSRCL